MAHNVSRLYKFRETFYYRVIIPKDLLLYFGGKQDVKKSLHTKSLTQARRLLRMWDNKTEEVFTTMRLGMVDDAQIRQFSEDYLHATLSIDEKCRSLQLLPLTKERLEAELQSLTQSLLETREALTLFGVSHNLDLHALFLEQKGLDLSPNDPEFSALERELLKRDLEIYRVEIKRTKGNYDNGYDDRSQVPLSPLR